MMSAHTPPTPNDPPPGAAAPEGLPAGRFELFRFVVLGGFLALWTWKLLEPSPVPEALAAELDGDWRFFLAKSLHGGAYAFLTVLVFALPVTRYWHWFLVGLLALHGVATEIGQTFVPNRTGTLRDVIIDWIGVAFGVLICYWARRLVSAGRKPLA
ncbi:VanZ family protein [Gemmata sp. JC717]|uniref:VanZ family protein n=1 Tax=Gemmata algarum TaxID=2975278 RepID=A0ABU5EXV9_9BACT|nr:VanZ family protein [Gemmata algarum]MDY3552063.1 VanZ family protein [Gemmata algarum]MDY3560136.1 VanZ family protein [Gemmata algarum]